MKILDGLYGFIWQSASENNCNSFLIEGSKKILVDPGHRHLFQHVRQGLERIEHGAGADRRRACDPRAPRSPRDGRVLRASTQWAMSLIDYEFVMKYIGSQKAFPEPAFFLQEGDLHDRGHRAAGVPLAGSFAGVRLSLLAAEQGPVHGRCGLQSEHRQDGPSRRVGKAVKGEHHEAFRARRGGSLSGSRGHRHRA